ncbi:MAG TPA: M56 family metallopeptidase [Steroidobacteraceae bacterium]|jgi:beta-lactamase regulating signal transducer with metallopeptidase domain|nr:M56 family metallopeptidase [Steroidobacteraceae bacterium]
MHEHVAPAVYYLEVHLLYASIVCLAAWVLTSLWKGNATWKYWIWVATSLNFIVPLGGFFIRFGASPVAWATQLSVLDDVGIGISRNLTVGAVLFGVWLTGAGFLLARLLLGVRRDRRDARVAGGQDSARLRQMFLAHGVPVRLSAMAEAPCVDGVLRPQICLPQGVDRLLSEAELDAVLIHEVTHARRRDNLVGLLHELALCGLWFHPLVWLTGFRLAMFRELSCDDSVIANSRGAALVSALAKLAVPEGSHLLRAGAASLLSHRVARLTTPEPQGTDRAADWLLIALFAGIFLACLFGTIAHNPSCFKVRI